MKCPHCQVAINDSREELFHGESEPVGIWEISWLECPECGQLSLFLVLYQRQADDHDKLVISTRIWPKGINRTPVPQEVPAQYTEDYTEAALILNDSPKASAALSRRCLQAILRDVEKVKKSNLYNEIEEVIDKESCPSHISEALHAVRVIGNMAAHPTKSKNTGEIVPVEPGEAEWLLEILEALFDHYFVQPAKLAKRKASLNKKLEEIGKQPID